MFFFPTESPLWSFCPWSITGIITYASLLRKKKKIKRGSYQSDLLVSGLEVD